MDQDIYRKILKHQSQLQRLEHTIERYKHGLLDVSILLESLKKSNKDLMNITAKTTKDARPYNQRKQYASSDSTSQSSTSARKQNTDDLENNFKKVYIQKKQLDRHPKKTNSKIRSIEI